MAYEKGKPEPGIKAKLLDDRVRGNNDFIQPAINNEHNFVDADAGNQTGDHTQGSARCFFAATAPAARIDTTSFIETDNGSLWVNSGDNALSIMTDYSQVVAADKWTLVSDEVIAVLLAANRVFAGTLGVTGDFAVNTDKFTVAATSGNTAVGGTLNVATSLKLATGATPTEFSTDGTLAGDSDIAVPTEKAVKTYVDDQNVSQVGQIKGWAEVTGSNGALVNGYNIASTQRLSEGLYIIRWDVDFANVGYCPGYSLRHGTSQINAIFTAQLASSVTVKCFSNATGDPIDPTELYVWALGDQ